MWHAMQYVQHVGGLVVADVDAAGVAGGDRGLGSLGAFGIYADEEAR